MNFKKLVLALVLVFVIGILGATMSDAAPNYNTSPCYKVGHTKTYVFYDGDDHKHIYHYTYMGNCIIREERFEEIDGVRGLAYIDRYGPGWCNCKPGTVDGGVAISPSSDKY